ncbi:MAG: DegT/DnrJ/EryC1/StrS family aminotransferase [Nitrospira defluvii]|nr:DegT/DnrJ/EryC1/StrS family aminotransferase [Nitrospira defluvii]
MKLQRTLPPTAAPLRWRDLLYGLAGFFRQTSALAGLEAEFRKHFGVKHVFCVTSGKAALALILSGLKKLSSRPKVIIPGYTCYSVPSAIVRAGLEVALSDVESDTLDFNFFELEHSLDEDVLCVVPTHLLGCPANVDRTRLLCQSKGIYVIEDAAQAFGGTHNGRPLGTLGDVGFFSFGRGKNLTCGSGGVVITNSDVIAQAIQSEYDKLPEESWFDVLGNWCQLVAMRSLIHPWLYWLPAGLPFLKLGETQFYRDFPMRRMDGVRAALLAGWRERVETAGKQRREHAEGIAKQVAKATGDTVKMQSGDGPAYLRFPILLKTAHMKKELCARSKMEGLGASPLYPTAIKQIPELRDQLSSAQVPTSVLLADRLVTLPTHYLVTNEDIAQIGQTLRDVQNMQSVDTVSLDDAEEEGNRTVRGRVT